MTKEETPNRTNSSIGLFEEVTGTVLIVDDNPSTVDLLSAILSPFGYNILTAQSGKEALEIVDSDDADVDIILLDIMMPEMNGYDVCKIVKSSKETRMIPILVISALGDLNYNIKAMEVGAEGFIAKPFNNQLVIAYVKSLIKIKKLSDEVIKLDQLKDDLTRMIIHDLRNPLISALGFISLSLKEKSQQKKDWYTQVIKSGVTDAFNLMENLHDITRLESNKLQLSFANNENIYLIISEIIDAMTPVFEKRGLTVKLISECNLKHRIDPQIFKRVIQNMLANAAKFARKDTSIIVNANKKKGVLRVEISNEGDVIPEKHWPKIFKKFGQVELKQSGENVGIGLGLAFCKLAIEAHGGNLWVESPAINLDDGTSFIFEIE
jgi:signal transduction histidine kinase